MTRRDPAPTDRAAAVRRALRSLVAHNGFHGASMAAVAAEAGVATGTAYVHYASKDDLVLAAYLEAKQELGRAAVAGLDPAAPAHERFVAMWLAIHEHLERDPDTARFLVQVEGSPYARPAHELAMAAEDDPLTVQASLADMAAQLAPLPYAVLYDLGIATAVRLVAASVELTSTELLVVAQACWRAVTTPP